MNDKNPMLDYAWPDDSRLSLEHHGVLVVVALVPEAASLAWLRDASSDAPADVERLVRELVALGHLSLDGDRIARTAEDARGGAAMRPRRHFTVTDATDYGLIRHDHAQPKDEFQMVPNSVARDGALSLGALGLLVHLRSHAEGFNVNAKALSKHFKTGEAAIRTYRRELVARGYLSEKREHRADGTLGDWLWTLTDPDDSDLGADSRAQADDDLRAETPALVNTSAGDSPPHKKTNDKNTNDKNTRALNAAVAASDDEAVDNSVERRRAWTTGDPIPDGTRRRLNDALLAVRAGTHLGAEVEHLRTLADWSAVARRVSRWCGVQAAVKHGAAPGPLVSALIGYEYEDDDAAWAAFLASSTPLSEQGSCHYDETSGYCDRHGLREEDHARL